MEHLLCGSMVVFNMPLLKLSRTVPTPGFRLNILHVCSVPGVTSAYINFQLTTCVGACLK